MPDFMHISLPEGWAFRAGSEDVTKHFPHLVGKPLQSDTLAGLNPTSIVATLGAVDYDWSLGRVTVTTSVDGLVQSIGQERWVAGPRHSTNA